MRDFFIALLTSWLSGLLWLLARLPAPLRRGVTAITAFMYEHLATKSRRTIVINVEHIKEGLSRHGVEFGSTEHFARQNLRSTAELLAETAICWHGVPEAWRDLIDQVHGDEAIAVLSEARARQSVGSEKSPGPDSVQPPGILLLSPHLGNWELLNIYLGAEFGLTALYDPPKIAALDPLIRKGRQRTRSELLPIGPSGLRGMVQRLKRGGVVGLLPDQVPATDAGVTAEFFGKQVLTINLVHRLVSRNRPRVFLVCALRNSEGRYDIHFDDLTPALTEASKFESATAMNAALEYRIAQAPEQYQWSYKRFKRAVAGEPNIYRR